MSIINQTKQSFNTEFRKIAKANIIRKLKKQGINHHDLRTSELNDLIADEIAILESDSKKVGLGLGVGLVITMLTGI